jgi:anti-sigma regulatory factor (Ser/Thr protein kinase)
MLEIENGYPFFFTVRGAAREPPPISPAHRTRPASCGQPGGRHDKGGSQEMSSDRHREQSMSCQLSHDPAQVGQAREQARRALCGWGLGEHAELAGLIVGELATNAIRHAAGPVQVRVSYARGDLRVEAHDGGAGRPARRPPTADDQSGRGLALLDDLIGLCGGTRAVAKDSAGPGKTVQVTVRLAAGGSPVTDAPAPAARRIHAGTPPGTGGPPRVAASCPDRRRVMCRHAPPCPPAHAPDREAARIIAGHPEQGWNLLCNGIVLFEDTGMLLPDGTVIEPHRAAGRTPADGLPPNRARPRGGPRAARARP